VSKTQPKKDVESEKNSTGGARGGKKNKSSVAREKVIRRAARIHTNGKKGSLMGEGAGGGGGGRRKKTGGGCGDTGPTESARKKEFREEVGGDSSGLTKGLIWKVGKNIRKRGERLHRRSAGRILKRMKKGVPKENGKGGDLKKGARRERSRGPGSGDVSSGIKEGEV